MWLVLFVQHGCVLVKLAKGKNSRGRTMKEPKIKEGGVDVEICLGSHVWWCDSEDGVLVY